VSSRPPLLRFRAAVPADGEIVASIWFHGWQDGHLGNVPPDLVALRTEERFRERAAQRIAETHDTWVAALDGEVVGFVMLDGDEVEQVYLAADRRGSGLAGGLLDEAERRIAAAGHTTAWLAVVAGNARARRFYEKRGWRDAGAFDYEADGPDGPIVVPSHRYEKRLDASG
jgi:GNAT superfamily N-acetyltransferase